MSIDVLLLVKNDNNMSVDVLLLVKNDNKQSKRARSTRLFLPRRVFHPGRPAQSRFSIVWEGGVAG
jgi:hypothetical protein